MDQDQFERVQKIIASYGVYSRRQAELIITEGRVKIDGNTVQLGQKADPKSTIEIDGIALKKSQEPSIVLALYKPTGYVSTRKRNAEAPHIVLDLLSKKHQNLRPVGRLDKDTSGLLLLTNNGRYLQEMTHPRYEHRKIYEVKIHRPLSPQELRQISTGNIYVLGKRMLPIPCQKIGSQSYRLTLKEGRNRHIRRMFRTIGTGVKSLKRIGIGSLMLDQLGLSIGKSRVLSQEEIRKTRMQEE